MFQGDLEGKLVCVFGVTFKPNTDDMRESPSLTVIPKLMDRGAKIRVVDPKGYLEGHKLLTGVDWFEDPYEAAKNSDVIVILTEWNEFRALDLSKLAKSMRSPYMADYRNLYSLKDALEKGFALYDCIGRESKVVT